MFQSLILGIIQGITEFLPISSSAHLILIPAIFSFDNGVADSLFFDVSLHFGTFLSVIIFFYKDWIKLIKGFFSAVAKMKAETDDERLIFYILLATIPAGVIGVLFEDTIDSVFHSQDSGTIYLAISLSIVSFMMIFAERFSKNGSPLSAITLKHALIIGAAQAMALFPGVSRSGITIVTGLLLGYKRDESARFSFLLSTPIIFGAFFLKFIKSFGAIRADEVSLYLTGIITSAVIGYVSIKFLMKFLTDRKLNVFAYYRLALAGVIIFLFLK
ncbi:undecaprenyl-diphosphatase UppP [Thermodesulfobacteriota bacterium]